LIPQLKNDKIIPLEGFSFGPKIIISYSETTILKWQKTFPMQVLADSVCIRCGKTRIYSKKWKDKTDGRGTEVTHVEAVCPDAECQKIVDEKFAAMREKREMAEDRKKSVNLAKTK